MINNRHTRNILLIINIVLGLSTFGFFIQLIHDELLKYFFPLFSSIIAYFALSYNLIKSLEKEEELAKDKKRITQVKYLATNKSSSNFQATLNKELKVLSKENIIVDIKILHVRNNLREAYVIYKKR